MDHTGLRVEMTAPIPKRNDSSGWGQLAICASALGFRFSEARPGPFGIGVAKSSSTRSAEACKEKLNDET